MKKVLIIDDQPRWHNDWRKELSDKVEIISAFSITEAEEIFAANPDIAAIVIDACVPGHSPTTLPLVRKFRETFTGPMIAVSSMEPYRQKLVSAGCNHESTKEFLPRKLLEVLGL